MRLAATVSVTLIALSTAALAQVVEPGVTQTANNMTEPGISRVPDAATDEADPSSNMLSNSASPPPSEPK